MDKVIIIRYCEIYLKGKNRGYFEKVFMNNLEKSLSGIRHEIRKPSGRYVVENFDAQDTVSYTHLDVYKRQPRTCSINS